jgi:hypothetical protein
VAEELRSISMRCWQTWHWKKATKGSLKPSNYGFDPIRPRNVMTNCLTEFSRVWALLTVGIHVSENYPSDFEIAKYEDFLLE